jgi:hypothetical protein
MGGGAAIILVVSLLGGQGFTELGRAGQQASLREAVRHRVFEINFQSGKLTSGAIAGVHKGEIS